MLKLDRFDLHCVLLFDVENVFTFGIRYMMSLLTPELAGNFARIALGHISRPYPYKPDHILNTPQDLREPRELHPIFYGSFDWHSCVHGYWLLARVLRRFPEMPEANLIVQKFETHFTPQNVATELTYLQQPLRGTFERPYGWAWLLMLAAELKQHQTEKGQQWYATLAPLSEAFVHGFLTFLPKATYPIRTGSHSNTAFALTLALEYAEKVTNKDLQGLIQETAVRWYAEDTDCQAWEPGGDDFLSPSLMEAVCMMRVLEGVTFTQWFERFLPYTASSKPAALFKPALVSDRSDGKIAHLDGLNLSRAWCWRVLSKTWEETDPRYTITLAAAEKHLEASLPQISGDYMGEHWLATFALLALDEF